MGMECLGADPGAVLYLFPRVAGLVPRVSLLCPAFPMSPWCPVPWGHVPGRVGPIGLQSAPCRGLLRGFSKGLVWTPAWGSFLSTSSL